MMEEGRKGMKEEKNIVMDLEITLSQPRSGYLFVENPHVTVSMDSDGVAFVAVVLFRPAGGLRIGRSTKLELRTLNKTREAFRNRKASSITLLHLKL
jgi:hypothetical protein